MFLDSQTIPQTPTLYLLLYPFQWSKWCLQFIMLLRAFPDPGLTLCRNYFYRYILALLQAGRYFLHKMHQRMCSLSHPLSCLREWKENRQHPPGGRKAWSICQLLVTKLWLAGAILPNHNISELSHPTTSATLVISISNNHIYLLFASTCFIGAHYKPLMRCLF